MKRLIESNEILCRCRYCGGYFPLDINTELEGGGLIVPRVLIPTIEDLEEFYKKLNGYSYEEDTGNKIKDGFVIGMREILHTCEDDNDEDGVHSLGVFECWCGRI